MTSQLLPLFLWGIIDNFIALAPIGLFLMAKQYYSSQNKFLELERRFVIKKSNGIYYLATDEIKYFKTDDDLVFAFDQ